MRKIGKWFVQGLVAILPIVVTLYLIYWLATSAESVLGKIIRLFLTDKYYVPGLGVVAGLLLTLGIGILLQLWLFRKVFALANALLEKIPGIKSLYGSIRDLVGFFDSSKQKDFDKTVMVNIGDGHTRLMGLVTREEFSDLPDGIGNDETVAVYLPMSYQLGGFTVMVPRERIEAVDMKVDEALQFVLTAAVSAEKKEPTEIAEEPES